MPGAFERILVPMKIGLIGEEVLGTAIKLAEEHGFAIKALYVMRVPLDKPLDVEFVEAEERAEASLEEGSCGVVSCGVEVEAAGSCGAARSARRSSRSRGPTKRRPDCRGLGSPLASPVAVLQSDGRLRPTPGALRGDGDRLSPGSAGGGRALVATTEV